VFDELLPPSVFQVLVCIWFASWSITGALDATNPVSNAVSRAPELARCLTVTGAVAVHRPNDARVAKVLLHDLRVQTLVDEYRCTGMPQVVDSDAFECSTPECRIPDTMPEVRQSMCSALWRSEHESGTPRKKHFSPRKYLGDNEAKVWPANTSWTPLLVPLDSEEVRLRNFGTRTFGPRSIRRNGASACR
jgi:hypothetical protein